MNRSKLVKKSLNVRHESWFNQDFEFGGYYEHDYHSGDYEGYIMDKDDNKYPVLASFSNGDAGRIAGGSYSECVKIYLPEDKVIKCNYYTAVFFKPCGIPVMKPLMGGIGLEAYLTKMLEGGSVASDSKALAKEMAKACDGDLRTDGEKFYDKFVIFPYSPTVSFKITPAGLDLEYHLYKFEGELEPEIKEAFDALATARIESRFEDLLTPDKIYPEITDWVRAGKFELVDTNDEVVAWDKKNKKIKKINNNKWQRREKSKAVEVTKSNGLYYTCDDSFYYMSSNGYRTWNPKAFDKATQKSVIEIVWDASSHKLRAKADDGLNGNHWVSFPSELRLQGRKYTGKLSFNGKNYSCKKSSIQELAS